MTIKYNGRKVDIDLDRDGGEWIASGGYWEDTLVDLTPAEIDAINNDYNVDAQVNAYWG